MAESDKVAIGSAAAVMAGDKAFAAFGETAAGVVVEELYESVVRGEMGERHFKFCKKMEQLSREVATPHARWDASYARPADVVEVVTVVNGSTGHPINYEVFETHIFCNAVVDDTIIMEYVFRADETAWPPQFRLSIIMMLAGYICMAVQEDEEKADVFFERASGKLQRAGFHSAQGSTSKRPARRGRLQRARYGRRGS